MTIPKELKGILTSDQQVMHGAVCFAGTRVPFSVLLDNLAEGMGTDEFLTEYPSVSLDQIAAVMAWAKTIVEQTMGIESAS